MSELQKHLDRAFGLLSKYPEDWGQLIDQIALARQELRVAFKLAEGYVEKKEDENNG